MRKEIFKKKYVTSLGQGIIPCYLLSTGLLIPVEDYENRWWEIYPYDIEDYCMSTFEGEQYFVEVQTITTNTKKEAKRFLEQQKKRLVEEKLQEANEILEMIK